MYEPNIYVNNSKFVNFVCQLLIMPEFFNCLRVLEALFISPKICPRLTVFNSISSMRGVKRSGKSEYSLDTSTSRNSLRYLHPLHD